MAERRCRICRCTDLDCSKCIERTGVPYYWIEDDLCSACFFAAARRSRGTPPHLSVSRLYVGWLGIAVLMGFVLHCYAELLVPMVILAAVAVPTWAMLHVAIAFLVEDTWAITRRTQPRHPITWILGVLGTVVLLCQMITRWLGAFIERAIDWTMLPW